MDDYGNDSFVSFVPESQIISRNFSALANLATLANLSQITQPSYSLENYRVEKILDPSCINIKEFSESFKEIKSKLKGIESNISELENKRDLIKTMYDETSKKLVEFFGISDRSELFESLRIRACEMISNLQLEKFYEERNNLLQHYKVAVPLLTQVKQEFFGNSSNIPSCPICYENDVTNTMLPCGHCVCDECKKKVINICFQCRSPVIKINRIYI